MGDIVSIGLWWGGIVIVHWVRWRWIIQGVIVVEVVTSSTQVVMAMAIVTDGGWWCASK